MASTNNRTSTYTQVSSSSEHDRPKSADAKKEMWEMMLKGVASGKKLPEKNIIVLGKFTFRRG
jgi:dynein light intermediate chain 1